MPGTATISWFNVEPSPAMSIFDTENGTSSNNASNPTMNSIPAGALLVLTCASADSWNVATDVQVTDNQSLTWTKRAETNTDIGDHGQTQIWTAPFSAGGNISVTATWQGTTTAASSSVLYAIVNSETTPGGASNSTGNQAAPSVNITTTRADSIIICTSSDWNATSGAVTYRDSATQVLDHDLSPGTYRGYHYYKQATTVTSYTEGISSPSTMAAGTCAYEIRKI